MRLSLPGLVLAFGLGAASLAGAAEPSFLTQRVSILPQFGSAMREAGGTALYGAVDLGLNYQRVAGRSRVQMQSGGELTSKIGLFMRENLGAGLWAEANLESGFQADTGAVSATLFNRESWIGLRSADFGGLRLGRQLPVGLPLFVDVFGTVGTNSVSSWVGMGAVQTAQGVAYNRDLGPGATQLASRVENAVKWSAPRWRGLSVDLLQAFNEQHADAPRTSNRGIMLNYLRGPVYLAASFNQVWSAPVRLAPTQAPQAVRNDLYGLGAVYDTAGLVLSAAYNHYRPRQADHGVARVYTLGAILPRGVHTWRLSIVHRDTARVRDGAGRPASSSAWGVMTGYDYQLSRRTALYARAGWVRNAGLSTIVLNGITLPTQPGGTEPRTGTRPMTASVGMYHAF